MHLARRIGRRRLLLLLAVLVGGLAALAPIPSLSKSRTTMKADSDDVASALHGARSAGPLHSRRTEISAFHMIGASWKGPITSTPRVRVHDAHGWGSWQRLELDTHGPDPRSREARAAPVGLRREERREHARAVVALAHEEGA